MSKGNNIKRDTKHIEQVANDNHVILAKQIDNIVLRQQELQAYITEVDQSIKGLKSYIIREKQAQPPNQDKIKNCQIAISRHIELISKLYESYRSFEETKFKYQKQISESNFKYIHMIEIDIRRIEEKLDNTLSDSSFSEVMHALVEGFKNVNKSGSDPIIQKSEQDLLEDPSYKM